METGHDPTGPGTEAWEAFDEAIRHLVNGRPDEAAAAHGRMTRALLPNCSVSEIREWDALIVERSINPEPDDFDTDDAARAQLRQLEAAGEPLPEPWKQYRETLAVAD